jgi:nitroreductase
MDALKPLIRTRQYRQFTDEPVSDADLTALAEVARWSGSSRNSQPWRFIISREIDLIRHIAEIGFPQTRSLRTAMAILAITLPDDRDHAVSYAYDEGRVSERLLIGASMLGLGAGVAWVTTAVRAETCQLLGVESGRFVRTIVAIGHPSDKGRAPKSAPGEARLPLDEVVVWR